MPGSRLPSALRLGPFSTKTVFKKTDLFPRRYQTGALGLYTGHSRPRKERKCVLSLSTTGRNAPVKKTAGRSKRGFRRLYLFRQHVLPESPEHDLVADDVGRRSGDRQLVGKIVGLGERLGDRSILHLLA